MADYKQFEIQVPIDGEVHIYKTDLICNACGKKLKNGDYLYFCMKDHDDLCSSYKCLKKHAGHRFFRWGLIEKGSPHSTSDLKVTTTSSAARSFSLLAGPTLPAAPRAPAASPPIQVHHVPISPLHAPAGPPRPSGELPPPSTSVPLDSRPAPPSKGSVIVEQPTIEGPVIRTGLASMNTLRDEMLRELQRLKAIIKGD